MYPLLIGRSVSLRVIDEVVENEKHLLLVAQRDSSIEDVEPEDLFDTGVVGRIVQVLRLPTGMTKILVEVTHRAEIVDFERDEEYLIAQIIHIPTADNIDKREKAALRRAVAVFKNYISLNENLPDELLLSFDHLKHPQQITDYIAAYVECEYKKKQQILEYRDIYDQLIYLTRLLKEEIEILRLEKSIDTMTREKMAKSQKAYYLQEQIKLIRRELGEDTEDESDDVILEYRDRITKARMPKEVREKAFEELDRLAGMADLSPEAAVVRTYLDWLCDLPWSKRTKDNLDIESAREILEEDHYGLEKPKERVLEHLSVLKLLKSIKGSILCFVGPPGVGKTSLGRSIARAMSRKFVRVSLGGVRDEAEIRGHRRTYIGSLPGRIIQSLKKVKTKNPVFVLDEIDKLSSDFRGDPASALLEALDPEQNNTFLDHYLDVDFDLSEILFITTANHDDGIPPALLDRMEIIRLPGYMRNEKLQIARIFLFPKQLEANGLQSDQITITREAILRIVDVYTREAGVRELERQISKICRKIARKTVEERIGFPIRIKVSHLRGYLGVPPFPDRQLQKDRKIGRATGLAWTSAGGDVLSVDITLLKGKGGMVLTGRLGDVMKESARAAFSYLQDRAAALGLEEDVFLGKDIHLHIPEGAVPKDGPSAGITIAAALYSAASGKPLPQDIAMTGEITLRGEVLGIGGLAEKLIAARRFKIRKVLIPKENIPQLAEVAPDVKRGLDVTPVESLDQVWDIINSVQ
jgi:ATP-dependent Lon protease